MKHNHSPPNAGNTVENPYYTDLRAADNDIGRHANIAMQKPAAGAASALG